MNFKIGQNDEKRFVLVVFKTWNLEAEKYLLNKLKTVNRPLGNSIGAQLVKTFFNREPTLYKLFVVKFKLWSCSQPSLILNLWIWGLINLWKWLFLQLVRKQPIQFLESKRKTGINVRTLSIGFVIFGSVPKWL